MSFVKKKRMNSKKFIEKSGNKRYSNDPNAFGDDFARYEGIVFMIVDSEREGGDSEIDTSVKAADFSSIRHSQDLEPFGCDRYINIA